LHGRDPESPSFVATPRTILAPEEPAGRELQLERSPSSRRRAGAVALAFGLALPLCAGSGFAAPHFERVGTESGPPPEVITAIYQDRAGFVWVGSRDGLFRYDGHDFVVFEHDLSDPSSISDHSIRVIYEDHRGNLWIGTNSGGLERLDRATWRFEHYRHDSTDPGSLSHDSVYTILEDQHGDLWVGTQKGLNRFDRRAGRFERFVADPTVPGSLSNDYIMTVYEDRDGRLWIGTLGGGLNLWNGATRQFRAFRADPDDPESLGHDRVHAIVEDADGGLWIGTGQGVSLMRPDEGKFRSYRHDPDAEGGLSHYLVSALAPGPPGKLWIGTFGGGLNELDIESGKIRAIRHDPARRNGLGDDRIMCLLHDGAGTLWVGTWAGGLSRLTASSLLLTSMTDMWDVPPEAAGGDVTALARDRAGGLWIGTREGHLFRVEPKSGRHRSYLAPGTHGGQIIHGVVEDRAGTIWVGSSLGVRRIDPGSGAVTLFAHDPGNPQGIGPGYVKAMLLDRAGRLWIGTGEGGVQLLDDNGRVVRRLLHDPGDDASLSDNYVTDLAQDGAGNLWVGTRSGGLNAVDPESGRVTRFVPDAEDPRSISHHYISSIVLDSRGRLWVGTEGGGLNRADVPTDLATVRFDRITAADGLIDDDVMAILEDDDGSLWLSTKRGLSRVDPDRLEVANFYVADGLPAAEFEAAAAVRSPGALHFGSVKGLVTIPSGTEFPPPLVTPTVIASIRTASGSYTADKPAWELEELAVPYGEWLSIEMAVLDYNAETRHAYAYRLGETEPWVDLGSRRAMTFTNLRPGTYRLAARGRNAQGVWSDAATKLQVRVVPPFWMTGWFRATVALVLLTLAVAGHQLRLSRLEKRNRELVRLHEQREKAREELRVAYVRLRQLTRRLEAAKEDERKKIARELHDDMGPSLTAVIINLQLLASHPKPEETAKRIADTVELVDRLVQQVRDLSLDLRPPLLDELGLIPALKGYLEAQANRTGLRIVVNGEKGIEGLPSEIEITAFRVVQEAVTNVIRHARAGQASVEVRNGEGELRLRVTDDGCGFDVEQALKQTSSDRALGLLGMQERVAVLGGTVAIRSTPQRGTRVEVRLPLGSAS
jgi:signal transduction histidine kinase/ligand-binding sensor domain-containing protein